MKVRNVSNKKDAFKCIHLFQMLGKLLFPKLYICFKYISDLYCALFSLVAALQVSANYSTCKRARRKLQVARNVGGCWNGNLLCCLERL